MTHSGAHSHQMVELVFETGYVCMQAFDLLMTEKYIGLGGGEGKRRKEKEENGGAGHLTFLLLQLSHTCPPLLRNPALWLLGDETLGFVVHLSGGREGCQGQGRGLGSRGPGRTQLAGATGQWMAEPCLLPAGLMLLCRPLWARKVLPEAGV